MVIRVPGELCGMKGGVSKRVCPGCSLLSFEYCPRSGGKETALSCCSVLPLNLFVSRAGSKATKLYHDCNSIIKQ